MQIIKVLLAFRLILNVSNLEIFAHWKTIKKIGNKFRKIIRKVYQMKKIKLLHKVSEKKDNLIKDNKLQKFKYKYFQDLLQK